MVVVVWKAPRFIKVLLPIYQVEICIRQSALRNIYSMFAVEAFHVENVRFLDDCAKLLDMATGHLSYGVLISVATKSDQLYNNVR